MPSALNINTSIPKDRYVLIWRFFYVEKEITHEKFCVCCCKCERW
ncbi:gp75 [Listeria phage B054]|nr:gp75 [Listeria phage B054]AAY53180.1 gp75 [Listeria phage B054]